MCLCVSVWRGRQGGGVQGECKGIKMWIEYLQALCFCSLACDPYRCIQEAEALRLHVSIHRVQDRCCKGSGQQHRQAQKEGLLQGGRGWLGVPVPLLLRAACRQSDQPKRLGVVDARGKVLIMSRGAGRHGQSLHFCAGHT